MKMKTKKKVKTQKTKPAVSQNDEDDLSGLMSSIQDDGGEMETAGLGDGEDIPASEINDVIKKLQLDRFKDISKKSKEKPPSKPDKTPGRKNKKTLQDKPQKEDKPHKKDNSTPSSPAVSLKNKKQKKDLKKKDSGDQTKNTNRIPQSSVERTPVKERTGKREEQSKVVKKISGALSLEVPKTSSMLLPTGIKWHAIQDGIKAEGNQVSPEGVISTYMEYATKLFDQEVEHLAAKKSSESGSQSRWMQTVAMSGALSDKVAALTLEVQGAPIHTPLSLDALLAMVRKKGRREALIGLDAAKRLFLEELLPSNRKLRTFAQHSFEELEKKCSKDRQGRDKQVLLWFFEDQLKQKYGTLLDLIEKMLQDTVSAIKAKALSCCYELIVNRPEEEKRLLRLIVNKVGDPDYKVAAKSVHWLQKLVDVHSMMKIVVVQAVEELLFRPNINTKAQYYAICFLNQLVLHPEEDQLATQLIIVYLSFFKACTKQKKIDNKMLSAVITGVHRAFPYSKEDEKVHEQLDTLLKVVHQTSFNTSIQALLLIKQVLDKRQSTMDRFYSALYRKLLDPHLSSSPRHAMFLNLLYQTLKSDDVINRVKAFVKRLLQVCSWQQPPFIAAVLVLVSELIRAKPSLGKLNSWNDDDDEDEHFMDAEEEEDEEEGGEDDGKRKTPSNPETPKLGSKDKASWVHRPDRPGQKEGVPAGYDPLARNPLHTHVDNAVMWELEVLSNHFHPSVALFASQLLAGSLVSYTGNPLQDFTSGRFLDRFVYKNPKQKLIGKESVMQPKSRSYKPPAIRNMPVNSKNFTSLTEESVPIDEMFFHRFFSQKDLKDKKNKESKKDKMKDSENDEDAKSEDEVEEEEEEEEERITSNVNMESPDDIDSDASSVDDEEFDRILDEMEGGLEDEDDDSIDFAGEFQKKSSKKSKKRKAQDEGSSDEDDDDDEEDDDVGEEEEDDEEMGESADLDGLDEEGFEMSDEEEEAQPVKASKRKQKQGKKNAKKQRKSTHELGDVTEQISSMIDENVGSKFDIGLNAMANKDKADMKQLRWEMDRDRWVRGVDARSKVRAKKLQKGPRAKGFKGKGRKQKR